MKLEIKELYRCGECREIHDDEDEARECCMPAVYTLYVCPVCAENHDEPEEAMSCCNADGISCPQCRRDYPSISIDYQAIKIAGHCTPATRYSPLSSSSRSRICTTSTPVSANTFTNDPAPCRAINQ